MRWGIESRVAFRMRVQECNLARDCNPMIASVHRALDRGCGGQKPRNGVRAITQRLKDHAKDLRLFLKALGRERF